MQSNLQNTQPSRKLAAPGASPMLQQPPLQNPYPYSMPDTNSDFSNFDFANLPPEQTYDSNAFDNNNFSYNLNTAQQPAYGNNPNAPTSQELVRRSRNNQLAPAQAQQTAMQQGSAGEGWNGISQYDDEDEAELERRVAAAKKDAQGKRKQIPPFVQKLSR